MAFFAGVHGPPEPDNALWPSKYFDLINLSKVTAVKVLCPGTHPDVLETLRQRGLRVMARVFYKFHTPETPTQVASKLVHELSLAYAAGMRWFELFNEPNINTPDSPEGMWVCWNNGAQFTNFIQTVLVELRRAFPLAKWGFPGLSPGPGIAGVRYDEQRFWQEAVNAGVVRLVDFLCIHKYWTHTTDSPPVRHAAEVATFCRWFPYKPVVVSEFSNPTPFKTTSPTTKGIQYAWFFSLCKKAPPNLMGAFSFLIGSRSGAFPDECWNDALAAKVSNYLIL